MTTATQTATRPTFCTRCGAVLLPEDPGTRLTLEPPAGGGAPIVGVACEPCSDRLRWWLAAPRDGKRIDEQDMRTERDRYPRICWRLVDSDTAF